MKMPVIGITCYPKQGGSGVVATELGLHLARLGCEVHFITSSLPFRLRSYGRNIFFHQVEMPDYPVFQSSPYTLSLATVMHDVVRTHKLDILHVHYAIPHTAAAFLAREMLGPDQVKVITTLHGTDITLVGQEPSFFPLTRFLIEKSDAVTCVSSFLKQETQRIFGGGEQIRIIPNFVDARVFRPLENVRQNFPWAQPGEGIILHVSNFRPVKNVPAVVEVFEKVCQEQPARLVFVGDGPLRGEIEELVASKGLGGKVNFLEPRDHLEEILPVADVLLLPSWHESFGLVALEAMACGVIPVVTSVGGAGEFITDAQNGFLREPDDIDGMAQAIGSLLRHDSARLDMSEDARQDATRDFGASCVVRQYLELYESLF